jgi:hypothetical protein
LSQNFGGGTEENPQPIYTIYVPIFEPFISRIRRLYADRIFRFKFLVKDLSDLLASIVYSKGKRVKLKLSLCLSKHNAMKAYGEWRYSSTNSFTSALDGGEWSASRPGRFTARERAAGTLWLGGTRILQLTLYEASFLS